MYNYSVEDFDLQLKYKEILYACLEEIKATKAALYLMEKDGNFSLKSYYGFTKKDFLSEQHLKNSPTVQTLYLERKPFYYNNIAEAMELAPLLRDSGCQRLLIAPIYLERIVGFIDVRDKAGRSPFDDQDLVLIDGIALRFSKLLKQVKTNFKAEVKKTLEERDNVETAVLKAPEESFYQKITSLQTSPSERVLSPVNQPPPEMAKCARRYVDTLMRFDEFVCMVVLFQNQKGSFVLLGGRSPLAGSFLQKLREEADEYTKSHMGNLSTGEGFFTHRYFPDGEVKQPEKLKRVINLPTVFSSLCRVFIHVFVGGGTPKSVVEIINSMAPLLKRSFSLEVEWYLNQQSLTSLLEKFVDPGLDRFTTLKIHSQNVAKLAHEFCEQLQINQMEIDRIATAAMLHDVGMRELDYENLYHKKKLTDEELNLLKLHPKVGAYIIQDLPFPYDVYSLVYYHHERYDGTGYPGHKMGSEIPLGARIIHILEAWDAMTSRDSYRPTVSPTQALEIMRSKAGIQFDPELLQRFVTFIQAKDFLSGN